MAPVIACIFALIELGLVLRFFFLLFGANPATPFVAWIYNITSPLVAPFSGIFGQPGTSLVPGSIIHSVFDLSTLIALLVVALVGGILIAFFGRQSSSL